MQLFFEWWGHTFIEVRWTSDASSRIAIVEPVEQVEQAFDALGRLVYSINLSLFTLTFT